VRRRAPSPPPAPVGAAARPRAASSRPRRPARDPRLRPRPRLPACCRPAGAVPGVGSEFFDALGQGGGHVLILSGPSFACKLGIWMRLLVLGARSAGLIAAARARGLFFVGVERDPSR